MTEFPFTDVLDDCKPVFEKVKGWNCDISKCRKKEELPKEALDYIRYARKGVRMQDPLRFGRGGKRRIHRIVITVSYL